MANAFDQLFALTSDAAFIDDEGVVVAANQAAADLYRVATTELIGAAVTELVPEAVRPFIEDRADRIRAGNDRLREVVQKILRADGSTDDVVVRSAPVVVDSRAVRLALLRPLANVAADTQAETARQRLFTDMSLELATAQIDHLDSTIETVLRAIAEAEGAGRAYVVMFDDDGEHFSCTHEWCRPGVEPQIDFVQRFPTADFHWSVGEVRANRVVHLPDLSTVPDQADAERRSFSQFGVRSILQVPMPVAGENEVVGLVGFNALDRSVTWSDGSIATVRRFAEAIATALLRRRAGYAIERARLAAEEANEAKTTFLSRMSHELRTPLNAVLGFTELLLLDAGRSEHDVAALTQVLDSGRHLLALVEDVLDISRIESGGLSLSMEHVDVAAVVDAAIAMASTTHRPPNVEVRVDIDDVTPMVRADRQRLQQVVLNLISNAYKYNRPGGRVTIGATTIDRQLELTVSDTGIGIPADALPRVFEPFDRLGRENTEVEGAGVGLALTRMIVEMMGGEIHIESTEGEGTVATVRFDIGNPDTNRIDGQRGSGDRTTPNLVLGIEDNEASALLLRRIVERESGLRFATAATIEHALAVVDDELPSLILLDLHLADGNGEEFLERFRRNAANRQVPVVVVTADTDRSTMQRVIAAGAVDFLPKPVSIDRLRDTIRRFMPSAPS